MRTFKTFLVVLGLLVVNAAVKADPRGNKTKSTVQDAVKGFIDAFSNGKVKGFADLLESDATFITTRGDKTVSYNRTEMLDDLRKSADIVQNCETSHELVENLPNQALVKVTMKYENFTKENLITLTNTNKGWKIAKVSTSFK